MRTVAANFGTTEDLVGAAMAAVQRIQLGLSPDLAAWRLQMKNVPLLAAHPGYRATTA
jgi:hypothetical protein